MKTEIINKIIDYFKENEDVFNDCIEELDIGVGILNDDRYYEMECLDEHFYDTDARDILYRAFYGYDEDTWHTDSQGNKEYGAFNPNRDYFYYNGYGNLVSTNYKDYSSHLDEYLIEEMSSYRRYVDTIDDNDELSILFDELEERESEGIE
jgi:hypothetical protein